MVNLKYDKLYLIKIAKENAAYFSTVSSWNQHAQKNNLPRAMTFSYYFGSWNKAKEELFPNIEVYNPFLSDYTKEDLIRFAETYKKEFTTARNWNDFSKVQGIPSSKVYIYIFSSWNNAKKVIFNNSSVRKRYYEEDELVNIALKHNKVFTTISQWTTYSKINNLPSSKVYEQRFGSWNKAKDKIFNT